MLDFESRFLTPLRSEDDDMEMGVFPLLAAAIPMVTSLAGSLMSKKSKKGGGPPPEAAQAQGVLDVLTKAIGADEGKGETSIKEVVKNIVATVPSPVMKQVKDAITELKNAEKAGIQKTASLTNAIDAKFRPQITAMLAGLKAQQLQTQATDEHRRIVAKEKYRKYTQKSLSDIQARLNRIETRLNTSAIVRGENRIALLGGRNILER